MSDLDRLERLRGVQVARSILEKAFSLQLTIVGPEGPLAHARGGVMSGSSEVCRTALFTREGFQRCDAFYRALATDDAAGERARPCHLGLASIAVPVEVGDGVVAHVVASGFVATALQGCPPADPATLATALRELDPSLVDPSQPVRKLPVVRGDREQIVRSILRTAAEEIAEHVDDERRRLRARTGTSPGAWGIAGTSPRMREVFELLRRVANSDAAVLITGESGTGKELVARALHDHGPRAGKPFVAQSCGAVPDDVLESTLFGHVRGAFSGAVRSGEGLFGAAHGGTLFLDEVAEMSPAMQVKLLRVLSDGSYLPVGDTRPRTSDVRVITATHRDLAAMVQRGEFRQDLYYRLHVIPIALPPLRDRTGDLPLLVEHFLRDADGESMPTRVSASAWRCLERYGWPGNVRELRAEIDRWAVTAAGEPEVGPEHLSPALRDAGGYAGQSGGEAAAAAASGQGSLQAAVDGLERAILVRGLERTGGNRTRLARELQISRTTLNERIKKFGLE
ncbi:sigma 54-interacting transcriptional regulator [Sandaracinus amylolyticus]|uniref:sigma 54-interacting transcriptional regulator n=1 Tax=Sandaracinus amylolyticus TaxID=927083 RepID=UPI001F20503E|nr:sigma 54-interacting transcriptional regulator [Sandaracinus amylolyticus]UJR78150.1 PEP-CTERM-box response regulator transcription factor [Sandaracinus amylolyticus]